MKQNVHYLDGKWKQSNDMTLSIFDLSIIRGFGVFDFLRTYHHKPFMLDVHIQRLFNSARRLGITVAESKARIKQIVLAGIEKNNLPDYNIRLVVTGGVSADGISPSNNSSLVILFSAVHEYPRSYYTNGISTVTYTHERVFPDVKSLNYLTAISALSYAKKKKALEVLFCDSNGRILEGTTSNFFAVIGGKLVTPKKNILIGITRAVVIDIAQELTVPVAETDLLYSQIDLFDEAFITASNKEVMPVVTIDGKKIGDGKVGPITKRIIHGYGVLTS